MSTVKSHSAVASLYRTYLRQVKQLPHLYLRQFFRLKVGDDFHALLRSKSADGLSATKLSRVKKDLRRIEAANGGSSKAFSRILDIAYGRTGKLRWELMKPLLSDPNAPLPPRIIPAVAKSRPPVYSPELKALLTSEHSRIHKPLELRSLGFPPTLPARADPTSEEARLLGPLSKRREVNIRWRYFTAEWQKVRPPLQVVLRDASRTDLAQTSKEDLSRVGIRGVGLQGQGVFEDIEAIVGPPSLPRPLTRKERRSPPDLGPHTPITRHPSRWLRRRYQELLGRLPILTASRQHDKRTGRDSGSHSVSLSPNAIASSLRFTSSRLTEVDPVNLAWLESGIGDRASDQNHES